MRRITVRIACVQLRARPASQSESALHDAVSGIAASASLGARVVVLPECTYPGYVLVNGSARQREQATERALRAIATAARRSRVDVCIGIARRSDGALRNEAVYIDRHGETLARYSKIFLWNFDARWFSPGRAIEPFETSFGRVGMMICADGRMPEIARSLALRGAWLLLDPTAWVGAGPSYDRMHNPQVEYLLGVRARENGVWIAAADKCGSELESVHYVGQSMVVAPDGSIAARAPAAMPSIVVLDLHGPHRPKPVVVTLSAAERRALRSIARPKRAQAGRAPRVRIGIFQGRRNASAISALRAQTVDAIVETSQGARAAKDLARISALRVAAIGGARMFAPEPARAAALTGADVVVWTQAPDRSDVRDVARARALENRVFVIACREPDGAIGSFVADPEGRVIAEGLAGAPCGFVATIDAADARDKCVVPGTDAFAARVPRAFALSDSGTGRS